MYEHERAIAPYMHPHNSRFNKKLALIQEKPLNKTRIRFRIRLSDMQNKFIALHSDLKQKRKKTDFTDYRQRIHLYIYPPIRLP